MKNTTAKSTPEIQVRKYTPQDRSAWDNFINQAKNATFLFQRRFMEYHSDRFEDLSLLVLKNNKLVALLPANCSGDICYSHQGLSYGGLVLTKKAKFKESLDYFKAVLTFLAAEGISILQLKLLPKIYHSLPAEELEYLLFLTEAKCVRTDISSTIDLNSPIKIQSNRLEGVKKAQKNRLTIEEGTNFEVFWNEILIPNLQERHGALPVHSLDEITQLTNYFPENIVQFNVFKGDKIVAGATIFETEQVAHVQYISANAQKQQLGSLDFLFHELITQRYRHKRYFDFGISNTNQGKNVNEGLLYWKECFGARSTVHQFYSIETSKYSNLENVFI
ncbi:GNAT family N-acetyltransferase [Altibacter sp.]|uniref:GNAT family N-acetyltransferase n=1 Tax=Altibacter sp. TaxID=2024823 RepID=UPI0025B80302|nr:GNAT family N-acetyltransferase [Altibacter sp.]